ncbi:MAG: ABC transporter substrate-binding protein [Chromatiales bacterium]
MSRIRRDDPPAPRAGMRAATLLAVLAWWLLPAATPAHEGRIRFGIAQAPITLDPRFATDATSERICRLLYRKLVDFDASYEPAPQLADWHQVSPTHYRFTLRPEGRVFHDGSRLTAADVKATYDYILEAANASPHRGSLAVIARIEAPDDDHLDFFLARPDTLLPGRLTVGIMPQRSIRRAPIVDPVPVGSGPLRFLAWPDESRLVLDRMADGTRIEFLTVPNPTVRGLKLVRGEIDLLQGDMPPELLGWLARQRSLQVRRVRGDSIVYVGFSAQDALTGQRAVREAIAHAIDREGIIRDLFQGSAQSAESVLLPVHWAGAFDLPAFTHDPAHARALLRMLGFGPDNPLRIVYKTSSDPFRIRLATIIQSQLKEVGIDVDLRSYDWGTFYGDIRAGRFQMYTLSWVGLKLPDIFRYAFHSGSVPPAGANRGRFREAHVDGLIEQAEAASMHEDQARLYRAVQAVLRRELPYFPLWREDVTAVMGRDLRGYVPAADGNYDGLMTARWP